ncbi:MAG: hypothetical protein ABIP44_07285 [Pseudoxanthomonas sp.]
MIRYEILMDEKHLAEALSRRRMLGVGRYIRGGVKIACLIGLLILLGILIYAGKAQLTVFVGFLIVLLGIGPLLDYLLLRQRLKKSPFYKSVATIELTEEGYSHNTLHSSGSWSWSTVKKVRRLSDGFVIVDVSDQAYWWPDSGLRAGTKDEVLELLSRTKGPE